MYQFDSVANVKNWLNSSTRQEFLDKAEAIFDGPGTQQVIARGQQEVDTLVTAWSPTKSRRTRPTSS